MSQTVQLGPFLLGAPLGSGGMGTVFQAAHEGTGLPVAVKVVRLGTGEDRLAIENLASEVRAVAALDHPHIVRIFDLGVVDPAAAAQAPMQLHVGTPWYAMELAHEGSLRKRMRDLEWSELRPILLQLLDALAHAHARDVLHLDLKPDNVLFGGRPGPKLSDFGMGVVGEVDRSENFVRGTPHFMAPEQVRGRWEDLGPWTDLYALGCIAWRCITGATPMPDGDPQAVLAAQVLVEPGAFEARFDVPDGLELWVRRLLQKDPDCRFRWAADAAGSLRVLDGHDPGPAGPTDWRVAEGHGAAEVPPEMGLGLAAVREPPLVGRTFEREKLWNALVEASAGRVRVVVLRGPAGAGKSRLARWLGARAHELGLGVVLAGLHGPSTHGEGLLGALRRHFPVDPRDADGLAVLGGRLAARGLPGPRALDAAALLTARDTTLSIGTLDEPWFEVAADVLHAVASERLPVVLLDSVQWGAGSLACLRFLLQSRSCPPAVWVLTVEDEELVGQPEASRLLSDIEQDAAASVLELGPLSERARAALVRRLLPLEPSLVAEVAERGAGNPLFEVELVQDWAQRGILERGPEGLRLRAGAAVPTPVELGSLWTDHLTSALEGHPEWQAPIEVAALLGSSVRTQEWQGACARLGLEAQVEMVDALVEGRLVRREAAGARWSFVHPLLRDRIADEAYRSGRGVEIHRACAAVVDLADVDRLALHLARAGETKAAIGPLLAALQGARADEPVHGENLQRLVDLVAATALQESDPRWAGVLDHRARMLVAQGRANEASEAAERQRVLAGDDASASYRAERNLARATLDLARFEEAHAHAQAGVASASRAGSVGTLAESWVTLCAVLRSTGRLEEAHSAIEWASLLALPPASAEGTEVELELGLLHLASGRLRAAQRMLEPLTFVSNVMRSRHGTAVAALALGDVLQALGRPEGALHAYRAARRRFRDLGHGDEMLAQVGLAFAKLDLGASEEADRALDRARGSANTARQRLRLALGEVAVRVFRRMDASYSGHWREAHEQLQKNAPLEPNAGRWLLLAAARAERPERSRELRSAARRLAGTAPTLRM